MSAIHQGIRNQTYLDDWLDFSGTITLGGTAQVLVPQQPRRTSIFIQNNAAADSLAICIGPPRATATIAGGIVTGITIAGGSMGYTLPPTIVILGGLRSGNLDDNPTVLGGTVATAHANMTGSAPNLSISSITVDVGGSGYLVAPTVYLMNPLPFLGGGTGVPVVGGATANGFQLTPGSIFSTTGMLIVPGSAISIIGATTGDVFECTVGGLV